MNLVIPMAGMGKRMRPHTLTVPKPLLPIAGKSIVQRLAENIDKATSEKLEEIAFVIGDFGKEVENNLLQIATDLGAKGKIFYQDEPLGTAHAILCAEECLHGKVIVGFADTLFKADFQIDSEEEGIIWVHKVDDPRQFGVVEVDESGYIVATHEKPKEFISDLAIIGIYYAKDGEFLKSELKYLIDNDLKERGEYQLTNALENMKNKGTKFLPGKVSEWLDCGNKDATVYTNQRILEHNKNERLVSENARIENSQIIPPCYVGDNVSIKNSVIGPHVSISRNSEISDSRISNTIVMDNVKIENKVLTNSMIGSYAECRGNAEDLSLGSYSTQA